MGYEFGYAYNRMELYQTDRARRKDRSGRHGGHQGFFRFLGYAVPEGKRVRPFASGGVHFTNYVPPGSSVTIGGGNTKFGVNYGVGIKFIILPNWLIRLDARQYLNGKPFGLDGATGYSARTSTASAWRLLCKDSLAANEREYTRINSKSFEY